MNIDAVGVRTIGRDLPPVGDRNIASRAAVSALAADRDRRGRNDAANVERNRRTTLPAAAANRLGLDPGSVITVAGDQSRVGDIHRAANAARARVAADSQQQEPGTLQGRTAAGTARAADALRQDARPAELVVGLVEANTASARFSVTRPPLPPSPPLPPIATPPPIARPVASPPTPPPPPTLCASSAIELVPVTTTDAQPRRLGRIDRNLTAIAPGLARTTFPKKPAEPPLPPLPPTLCTTAPCPKLPDALRMPGVVALPRVRVAPPPAPQTRHHRPGPTPSRCSHLRRRRRHWLGRGPLAHLSDRLRRPIQNDRAQDGGACRSATPAIAAIAAPRARSRAGHPACTAVAAICIDKNAGDRAVSLSDRDHAAAEKHIGGPAIASRTAIAPPGDQGNYNSHLRLCHHRHRPANGGGAQTKPS